MLMNARHLTTYRWTIAVGCVVLALSVIALAPHGTTSRTVAVAFHRPLPLPGPAPVALPAPVATPLPVTTVVAGPRRHAASLSPAAHTIAVVMANGPLPGPVPTVVPRPAPMATPQPVT